MSSDSIQTALIVTNLATLIALITFIFKCGVFVAETKIGIKDAKDSAIRAHRRIDKFEDAKQGR